MLVISCMPRMPFTNIFVPTAQPTLSPIIRQGAKASIDTQRDFVGSPVRVLCFQRVSNRTITAQKRSKILPQLELERHENRGTTQSGLRPADIVLLPCVALFIVHGSLLVPLSKKSWVSPRSGQKQQQFTRLLSLFTRPRSTSEEGSVTKTTTPGEEPS